MPVSGPRPEAVPGGVERDPREPGALREGAGEAVHVVHDGDEGDLASRPVEQRNGSGLVGRDPACAKDPGPGRRQMRAVCDVLELERVGADEVGAGERADLADARGLAGGPACEAGCDLDAVERAAVARREEIEPVANTGEETLEAARWPRRDGASAVGDRVGAGSGRLLRDGGRLRDAHHAERSVCRASDEPDRRLTRGRRGVGERPPLVERQLHGRAVAQHGIDVVDITPRDPDELLRASLRRRGGEGDERVVARELLERLERDVVARARADRHGTLLLSRDKREIVVRHEQPEPVATVCRGDRDAGRARAPGPAPRRRSRAARDEDPCREGDGGERGDGEPAAAHGVSPASVRAASSRSALPGASIDT